MNEALPAQRLDRQITHNRERRRFKEARDFFLRVLNPEPSPHATASTPPTLRDLGNFFGVAESEIVRKEEIEYTTLNRQSWLLAETVVTRGYRLPGSCQKLSTQIVNAYAERKQYEPDRRYTPPLLSVLAQLELDYDLTIDKRGDYYLLTLPKVQKMIIVNNTRGDTYVLHLPPSQAKDIIGLNKNQLKALQRNARQPQEILTPLTIVNPREFKKQLCRALDPVVMPNPPAVDVKTIIASQPYEDAPPDYRTIGGLRLQLSIHSDTMMRLIQEVATERGLADYRDMVYLYLNSTNRLTYYLSADTIARIKEKHPTTNVPRLDGAEWGTTQDMVDALHAVGITGHRSTIARDLERIVDDFEAERRQESGNHGDENDFPELRAEGVVRGNRSGTTTHYRRGELWEALVARVLEFYSQLESKPGELDVTAIMRHLKDRYGVVKTYRRVATDIEALVDTLHEADADIYKARRIHSDDGRKLWCYSPKIIQLLGERYKTEYESYPEIPDGWIDFKVLLQKLQSVLADEHEIIDVGKIKQLIRKPRQKLSERTNANTYLQKCRVDGYVRLYYSPTAYAYIRDKCVRAFTE